MAALSDIHIARQEAVDAIDTVLDRATGSSFHPHLAGAIEALRARKAEIESLDVPASAHDVRVDWTVETLRTAVHGMRAVGQGMNSSDRIVENLDTFLGAGAIVVGAVRMMSAPRYKCPKCPRSSVRPAICPVDKVPMQLVSDGP
ncbi:MAG TPA: hypothetical protein VMI56_13010 [Reyranella sp.]|nr:hypothetical protein [Reyranella sp.]